MNDANFPFWPPGSPQSAYKILGNGTGRGIEDLMSIFGTPVYREIDVPINGRPALSAPKTNEKTPGAIYGTVYNNSLFDMFNTSVGADPVSQLDPQKAA